MDKRCIIACIKLVDNIWHTFFTYRYDQRHLRKVATTMNNCELMEEKKGNTCGDLLSTLENLWSVLTHQICPHASQFTNIIFILHDLLWVHEIRSFRLSLRKREQNLILTFRASNGKLMCGKRGNLCFHLFFFVVFFFIQIL